MSKLTRRKLVLGGALLAGTGLSWALRPSRHRKPGTQAILERGLPRAVGPWREWEIPGFVLPEREALDQAIYDGFITRAFGGPDPMPVYLVVAYGSAQDYGLQVHRPDQCYPASGFTVEPLASREIAAGQGRRLAAEVMQARRALHEETVLYWTRIGAEFPRSQWDVRRALVTSILGGEVPDGVVARFSTPETGPRAIERLAAFAAALLEGASPAARHLLLG